MSVASIMRWRFSTTESGNPISYCPKNQKGIATLEDLLVKNFIPTCSAMYRRGLVGDLPVWYGTLPWGDWPWHILHAQHGNIGYINDVMAVHRIHGGGAWSRGGRWSLDDLIKVCKDYLEFYGLIGAHLGDRYEKLISERTSLHEHHLAEAYIEQAIDSVKQEVAEGSRHTALSKVLEALEHRFHELSLPDVSNAFVLGRVYAGLTYASYRAHDLASTRSFWVRTIWHCPSWLRSRDAWSMGVEAFLGAWVANCIRRTVVKTRQLRVLACLRSGLGTRSGTK